MLHCAHDELTNRCRIAQLLGPPFRYAGAGAEIHLGEIDERKLYLDWAFSSMFAFCVGELRFSEDVACNRINVARAARRMPVILEAAGPGTPSG